MSETPKRILVIDDDDSIRLFIRRVLERQRCEVLEARNGDEGIRMYRENLPDLVLLDLYMPEKDGLETLRELRKETPPPRVVTMSGGGPKYDVTILQSARFLGSHSALVKPFSIGELLELVRGMLEGGPPSAPA
ncbi:MAG: response regulator [Lentisphaerae bacterium]|nr:response regulator [Lentisphaerota bacterium]